MLRQSEDTEKQGQDTEEQKRKDEITDNKVLNGEANKHKTEVNLLTKQE